jgi:hypothetical protein
VQDHEIILPSLQMLSHHGGRPHSRPNIETCYFLYWGSNYDPQIVCSSHLINCSSPHGLNSCLRSSEIADRQKNSEQALWADTRAAMPSLVSQLS